MDRDSFILPGILIVVLLVILVIVVAFAGNNTFNMGKVSFQYPGGWSQSSPVGNFSNGTLYSEVTFTSNVAQANGTSQPAYIIVQIQQKTSGAINYPTTAAVINTTDSSVSTTNVSNFTATQIGSAGSNFAEKTTIVQVNNYYMIITYITPTYALNQTADAYNMILKTLTIS